MGAAAASAQPGGRPYERADVRRAAGETIRPGGLALTGRALAWCDFPAGARVLDLGCGTGATAAFLRERGLAALGLDVSSTFVAEAAAHAFPLLQAEAEALPLADGCLDGVFCECVLSAVADPVRALSEIRRVLKPGGRLAVADLFLRSGSPAAAKGGGCAAGALPREASEARLIRHGLTPIAFEDHTKALIDLSCRLVFTLGSARQVLTVLTGRDPACDGSGARPRFGYGLTIAAKEAL